MSQKNAGFTLIELMIVVAIIGILAAVAIPNFLNARGKAQDATAQSTLEAIKTSLEMYAANIGCYPIATSPSTLSSAMAGTDDWPSNITHNDGGGIALAPGTFTDYSVSASLDTYALTAKGRDVSHYFHLTHAGAANGPDANDTAAAP